MSLRLLSNPFKPKVVRRGGCVGYQIGAAVIVIARRLKADAAIQR
jgi:hypothetical protein